MGEFGVYPEGGKQKDVGWGKKSKESMMTPRFLS